jgi:predicted acyl esterase
MSPAAYAAEVDIPMLFVGGWYASHLPGTLAAYRHYSTATAPTRLVVGPWAAAHRWTNAPVGCWMRRLRMQASIALCTIRGGRRPRSAPLSATRPDRPNRSAIDARGDVVTFTTTPFTQELRLAGEVAAELWLHRDRSSFDLYICIDSRRAQSLSGSTQSTSPACTAINHLRKLASRHRHSQQRALHWQARVERTEIRQGPGDRQEAGAAERMRRVDHAGRSRPAHY